MGIVRDTKSSRKIPSGMLYILFSFTPWVVYWVNLRDQSINTKRPYFKTPIKGLYLASASTFPGGGIEAVVISGILCANDICGWNRRGCKDGNENRKN